MYKPNVIILSTPYYKLLQLNAVVQTQWKNPSYKAVQLYLKDSPTDLVSWSALKC